MTLVPVRAFVSACGRPINGPPLHEFSFSPSDVRLPPNRNRSLRSLRKQGALASRSTGTGQQHWTLEAVGLQSRAKSLLNGHTLNAESMTVQFCARSALPVPVMRAKRAPRSSHARKARSPFQSCARSAHQFSRAKPVITVPVPGRRERGPSTRHPLQLPSFPRNAP